MIDFTCYLKCDSTRRKLECIRMFKKISYLMRVSSFGEDRNFFKARKKCVHNYECQ